MLNKWWFSRFLNTYLDLVMAADKPLLFVCGILGFLGIFGTITKCFIVAVGIILGYAFSMLFAGIIMVSKLINQKD